MIEISEEVFELLKIMELGRSLEEVEKELHELSLEDLKILSECYTLPTDDRLLNVPNYGVLSVLTPEEYKAGYIKGLTRK